MIVEHIYKRNWRSLFVSYDFCVVASVAFWQNKTKKALAIFHAHCYLSRKEVQFSELWETRFYCLKITRWDTLLQQLRWAEVPDLVMHH